LEQYQRRRINTYVPLFEIRTWDELRRQKSYQSYILSFHNNIYLKLSKEWQIDIPILDLNLARLQQCAMRNGVHFSFNDLPLALEFFLQMDIDVFHLKTCSFRQGQPRVITKENGEKFIEGIFTMDQQTLEGRYGLTTCNRSSCLCCKNRSSPFDPKQIHCFSNQYKAILNCPVVSYI